MNIILIMSDTFRYDNLSCYRPALAKTPHLDRFAAESFVFDNAYLSSFPTIPNRIDLMSGCFGFTQYEWQPLPAEIIPLQQVLSASGLVTQLIADNPHLVEMGFNFERGFDAWDWIRGQETDKWQTAPKEVEVPPELHRKLRTPNFFKTYLRNTAWWQREEDHFAPRTLQAACDWLDRNQDQDQFFLWVDLFDPHEPWDAPQHYVDLYNPGYEGLEVIYPNNGFWREFLTEEELNHMRAMYLAEVSMVDHWFGVLLDKIEELGLTEDTAVIFMSDHGYLFGEHDLSGKSLFTEEKGEIYYESIPMYAELCRIPLIMRLPGQTSGSHISALVQTPDLTPTILEMAGLLTTETIGGQAEVQALQCGVFYTENWEFKPAEIDGRSVMPLLRGETNRLRDIAVASTTLIHQTPALAKCAIVTEDGWCLHYSGSYDEVEAEGKLFTLKLADPALARIPIEPQLFYLPDDPGELNNLFYENEGLAREIHARYVAWLEAINTPAEHLAGRRKLL
jgi:arylsulfatase A-like enzyme